jgi:Domain of unknown function (DUF4331)
MNRTLLITVGLSLAVMLSSCKVGESLTAQAPTPTGPAPPPPIVGTSFTVARCLDQIVDGRSVRDIMIPDLVTLDTSRPASFPNGRRMQDPVIDIEVAYLFLDLTRHSPNTLVNVPLNPLGLDQPLRTTFPYYAPPLGIPVLSARDGTNFNFRNNPESEYVRVERVGVPAVSTINVLAQRVTAPANMRLISPQAWSCLRTSWLMIFKGLA